MEQVWWGGRNWQGRRVETVWSDLLNLKPGDPDLKRVQLILYQYFGNQSARMATAREQAEFELLDELRREFE